MISKKKMTIMPSGSTSTTDTDAQAFVDAALLTDGTQITAIDNLVISLKSAGLWTKLKAIYPFVGGTAFTHKFNLKDPRDLDEAFRLEFINIILHDSNGITTYPGYAQTFFIPSLNITYNSEHLSIYSKTNNIPISPDSVEMGVIDNISKASILFLRGSSAKNSLGSRLNYESVSITNTDAKGFFLTTKNSSSTLTIYRDGVSVTSGISNGSLADNGILIGACTLGLTGGLYGSSRTNQNYAFSSIGDGFSSTEQLNYYNIIQSYQTELSRQN